jgi:hypothetical protein
VIPYVIVIPIYRIIVKKVIELAFNMRIEFDVFNERHLRQEVQGIGINIGPNNISMVYIAFIAIGKSTLNGTG